MTRKERIMYLNNLWKCQRPPVYPELGQPGDEKLPCPESPGSPTKQIVWKNRKVQHWKAYYENNTKGYINYVLIFLVKLLKYIIFSDHACYSYRKNKFYRLLQNNMHKTKIKEISLHKNSSCIDHEYAKRSCSAK